MKLQILDADYTMLNNFPVIRIFGKTKTGKTYCVFVKDFLPYFYVNTKDESGLKESLEEFGSEIVKIEKVKRYLPFGYQKDKTEVFKITNRIPSKVPTIREKVNGDVYEADILFRYRFFADMGIKGMGWIDVNGNFVNTNTVYCGGLEAKEIKPIDIDENVPLRILSLDIETETPTDHIPEPKTDGIIMISLAFSEKYKNQDTMVLISKHIKNGERNIVCTDNEKEMLEKLREIIIEYDPDVITGYNIQNFDIPFILGRMDILGVKKDIGRVKNKPVYSSTYGMKTTTNITGRIIFDSYLVVRKDFSLKTYTLDNVAKNLLNMRKIDIKYKDFDKYWNGNLEKVRELIEYSRKDAVLALELMERKNLMDKYIALSRVSGVLLQDVLDGGEAVRIENILLSEFKKRDVLFPMKPENEEVKKRMNERKDKEFKGGFVMEPKVGLHTDGCILVLDFKSLYPSIIRTYNICPTTILIEDDKEVEYNQAPNGAKFVKRSVREGIVPNVLERLIDQRAVVKKDMYREKDPDKKRILNAKQYALKIMANAFYGYMGYLRARVYMLDIATAITSFGRSIIQSTRKRIIDKGFEVIYGDTDSVFVKTNTTDLEKAYEIGNKITNEIKLPGKLVLEFEKIFRSFLILTKKRYAGWAFEKTNGEWTDKIEMKGIETVRRDWPDLITETMNTVLNIILKEGDVKKAISYVQKEVDNLNTGNVDLRKLAVTKSITKNIDKYDGMLPHIELAKKIRKRDPSKSPSPGTRISFVIVKGNQMLSKRAEDPEYIKEHNLKIDSDYYINNQLIPPLERIFHIIGVDKGELIGTGRQSSLKELFSKGGKSHKINTSPAQTKIKHLEGFVCVQCNKTFRRIPLTGRCECGGEVLAQGDGSMGYLIESA
ncbi:MAG: DNA polymerase elongation subunit [Candidatus Aenigmarchaeota archaeon]|nr:DNA polymerase elongation subunit [Candidatus Aenigmarchaeota archaeon]